MYPDRTNDGDKNLDDDEFFVDRIVDRRVVNQGNDEEGDEFQYKIRWRGYLPEEDSWKTIEDLRSCLDLVVHFNQSHPLKSDRERQLVAARKEPRRASRAPRGAEGLSGAKFRTVRVLAAKTP